MSDSETTVCKSCGRIILRPQAKEGEGRCHQCQPGFKGKPINEFYIDINNNFMNIEKGFTPTLDDEQKIASIQSQRDSIKKILADLDRQEAEIKKTTSNFTSVYEAWKNLE